jgi:hypothetical protein
VSNLFQEGNSYEGFGVDVLKLNVAVIFEGYGWHVLYRSLAWLAWRCRRTAESFNFAGIKFRAKGINYIFARA